MGITGRLKSTAVHKRKSRTTDSRGGSTLTFTTVTASLACRVSMKGSSERERANREEGIGNYKIYVGPTDIVKMFDTLTVDSREYEIVGISRPSRGLHIELEGLLIEVGT